MFSNYDRIILTPANVDHRKTIKEDLTYYYVKLS